MTDLFRRPIAQLREVAREDGPERLLAAARAAWLDSEAGDRPLHALLAHRLGDQDPIAGEPLRPGPLSGIPVALKDNLATADLPTTCGSRVLEGYRSPFEATVVRRLRAAGAVVVAKTNMDEFGMGSSTEHSAFGPTRNPRDRARVPGGSSGGSAAAVAAGIVPAALGSDTGGSVRQPAALCGVVGLKPTYGRVSRYGLVAYASSLDQVGVLAARVEQAAAILQVIAGRDPADPTCAAGVPAFRAPARIDSLRGLTVGVDPRFGEDAIAPTVAAAMGEAARALQACGATITEVELPRPRPALAAYYSLACAGAASNLARFDGLRYGAGSEGSATLEAAYERARGRFGAEVRRRILFGTYVLADHSPGDRYARAAALRSSIESSMATLFGGGVDLLLTPTTPEPAFPLGERASDPVRLYGSDLFTVPPSLARLPALSVPVGAVGGLPIGAQLIARWWDEALLLAAGEILEAALGASVE